MIVHLLTLTFLGYQVVESQLWKEFERASELNDMIFIEDLIFDTVVKSKLDCGRQCCSRPCCVTFTFSTMTSGATCRGHLSRMTSESAYVNASGAGSYIRGKSAQRPGNCAEAITMGYGSLGLQRVDISPQLTDICVACVKDWTVILRRQPSSVDFYRGWEDYVNGFGDVDGAHWLGLEAIHQLTSQSRYDLRVELEDWEGLTATADYVGFALASAADNYTLQVDSFVGGSAGDSLSGHSGMQFSTKDVDNDIYNGQCAVLFVGAWWYSNCHSSSLCGEFRPSNVTEYGRGVQWRAWKGYYYSLKFAQMMIRPSD